LFGSTAIGSAQGIYTTGIALSPNSLPPGGFNLEGHFESGTPNIVGFGYSTYTVNANLNMGADGSTRSLHIRAIVLFAEPARFLNDRIVNGLSGRIASTSQPITSGQSSSVT
jgi:hypothetical protein